VRRDQLTVRPDMASADPPVERKSHSSYGGWHRDLAGPPTRSVWENRVWGAAFSTHSRDAFPTVPGTGRGTRGRGCGTPAPPSTGTTRSRQSWSGRRSPVRLTGLRRPSSRRHSRRV
jgi:hypothetical protein